MAILSKTVYRSYLNLVCKKYFFHKILYSPLLEAYFDCVQCLLQLFL
jgi:hypothetical protein